MKNFIFIVILLNNWVLSQEKQTLSDSIPGWFRFEKNSHSVALMPTYFFGRSTFPDEFVAKNNILGFYLNYHYYPIRRLGVGLNVMGSHGFASPHNDYNQFSTSLELKYIFKGENRWFFYPMVDLGMYRYSYITNTVHTWANEPNQPNDYKTIILIPIMRIGGGVGLNIYNNMTFNLFYTNISQIGADKTKFLSNNNIFLSFHYHFNRSPQLPRLKYKELKLGETIKSWF